jgi:hypothetical protein
MKEEFDVEKIKKALKNIEDFKADSTLKQAAYSFMGVH